MIQVKDNYRNGHSDLTCRACGEQTETQKHVLYECRIIHPTITNRNMTSVYEPERSENHQTDKNETSLNNENQPPRTNPNIFTENVETLREKAKNIMKYVTILTGK